jgi:hypothetical protein
VRPGLPTALMELVALAALEESAKAVLVVPVE